MTLNQYTPLVWKDTDNANNPAGPNDPFLDASELNNKENLFKSIVDAVISLQTNAGGYTDTQARQAIGAALIQGSGISIGVNSSTGAITISTTLSQYTDEQAQDAVAAMITSATHQGVSWFYDDSNNKLSAIVSFPVTSVAGKTGDVILSKGDVGLDQVNNTSDSSKPVSTLQQTALDQKITKWTTTSDQVTNVTAAPNQIVVMDTSAGTTLTVTAPSSGAAFGVRRRTGTGSVVIQAPSGYTIRGASSITMTTNELVTYQLFGSDYQSTGGEKPQSTLNALFAPTASPTFTGTNPVLPGNATSSLQAVPKQQIDALNVPITSIVSSNVTVNNSTVLTNTGITLTLPVGWWALDGWFSYFSNTTANAKFQFNNNTSNSYLSMSLFNPTGGSGAANIDTHVLAGNSIYGASGDNSLAASAIPHGICFVSVQDVITVSFAQNTANSNASTIYAGSWLRAQKVA